MTNRRWLLSVFFMVLVGLGVVASGHAMEITQQAIFSLGPGAALFDPVSLSTRAGNGELGINYAASLSSTKSLVTYTGSLGVHPQIFMSNQGPNVQMAFTPDLRAGILDTTVSGAIDTVGFVKDGSNSIRVSMPSDSFTFNPSSTLIGVPASATQFAGGTAIHLEPKVYEHSVSTSIFSREAGTNLQVRLTAIANLHQSYAFDPQAISGKMILQSVDKPFLQKGEQTFTLTRAFGPVAVPLRLPAGQWSVRIEDLSLKASFTSDVAIALSSTGQLSDSNGKQISKFSSRDQLNFFSQNILTLLGHEAFPTFFVNVPSFGAAEPGLVLLLGSGLVGLVGWRRIQARSVRASRA